MGRIQISNDPSGRISVSFPHALLLVEKVNPAVPLEGQLGAPPTLYPAVFNNALCNGWVKTIDGRQWHPDEKHWSFPNKDDILEKILKVFGDKEVEIDPVLKTAASKIKDTPSPLEGEGQGEGYHFEDLRRELVSRKYSYKTIKGYLYYNKDLIRYIGKSPSEIDDEDIKDYLVYLAEEKEAATSTLNQAINALKFYYGTMLKKKFMYEVKRPRKDKKLPIVLSKEDVTKIINSVDNLKHKALLMLVYSAGLRVGEVVRLKPEDIDSDRMLIHIIGAKGRKDRYTMLSEIALSALREYLGQYKPANWLFEGARSGRYLSTRSTEKIFEHACQKAQIRKDVSVHALSHRFATYLLEGGTDLRYIQEILGHQHSKTTGIYTHVSTKSIGRIKSPLDNLNLKGGGDV